MIKVLFLASNPEGTEHVNLDEEIRRITQKLRLAEFRDVKLESLWAVRPDDLLQGLLEHKPHIVHFSGHGNTAGEIILMDNNRQAKPVSAEALRKLFATLKDNIRVVVLNACYSQIQATAIAEVIDCVIGMDQAIGDNGAITFAAAFYQAIGFGRSISEAFELGKTAIMLESIPEADTPQLIARLGVDPTKIIIGPKPLPPFQKNELVNALLACISFRDRKIRDVIVDELPHEISTRIDRNEVARIDATNIVSRCMDFSDGIDVLIAKVREYEGDSLPMRQLDAVVCTK